MLFWLDGAVKDMMLNDSLGTKPCLLRWPILLLFNLLLPTAPFFICLIWSTEEIISDKLGLLTSPGLELLHAGAILLAAG